MKAIIQRNYGSFDVLEYGDVEKPTPRDDEVLVKVHATAINFGNITALRQTSIKRMRVNYLKIWVINSRAICSIPIYKNLYRL